MKREFDFENIGTKMSYTVPKGYFEQLTARTVNNAIRHNNSRKKSIHYLGYATAIAAVICMAVLLFTPQQKSITHLSTESSSQLSNADIEALNEINIVLQEMPCNEIEQVAILAENDFFFNDIY